MIEVSLKKLNDSFPALMNLLQQPLPKEKVKLSYRLGKTFDHVREEMEIVNRHLNSLMEQCGFCPGGSPTPEQSRDYNRVASQFLSDTTAQLWGFPVDLAEIGDHVTISPADLGLLNWLIFSSEEGEGDGKDDPGKS